jgi:DNA repair exonuclease SbcCD nuclease subunit
MGAVELLLEKHKAVRVIVCEGNHDMASSLWIRKAIGRIFMKNERVTIDDTDFPFYAYLHGDIMIGFHHGHKVKNKEEYLLNNIPSSSNELLFDIRIQKILDYDETEYNKLIKFIDTPKLDNWPDLVYNYMRNIYVQI